VDLVSRVKARVAAIQKAMSSATASITEIRETIATLKAEREAVRSAPVPLTEALPQIDKMLAYWAHDGQSGGVGRIAVAAMQGQLPNVELHSPRATVADTLALLVPLLQTHLRDAFFAELEAHYAESPPGLPADERRRRLAELDAEIARLEVLEEEAIQAAASGGLEIARRPDASPAALLGFDA
jgi:hypothetical protein